MNEDHSSPPNITCYNMSRNNVASDSKSVPPVLTPQLLIEEKNNQSKISQGGRKRKLKCLNCNNSVSSRSRLVSCHKCHKMPASATDKTGESSQQNKKRNTILHNDPPAKSTSLKNSNLESMSKKNTRSKNMSRTVECSYTCRASVTKTVHEGSPSAVHRKNEALLGSKRTSSTAKTSFQNTAVNSLSRSAACGSVPRTAASDIKSPERVALGNTLSKKPSDPVIPSRKRPASRSAAAKPAHNSKSQRISSQSASSRSSSSSSSATDPDQMSVRPSKTAVCKAKEGGLVSQRLRKKQSRKNISADGKKATVQSRSQCQSKKCVAGSINTEEQRNNGNVVIKTEKVVSDLIVSLPANYEKRIQYHCTECGYGCISSYSMQEHIDKQCVNMLKHFKGCKVVIEPIEPFQPKVVKIKQEKDCNMRRSSTSTIASVGSTSIGTASVQSASDSENSNCLRCGETFHNFGSYAFHIERKCSDIIAEDCAFASDYLCHLCNARFSTMLELELHREKRRCSTFFTNKPTSSTQSVIHYDNSNVASSINQNCETTLSYEQLSPGSTIAANIPFDLAPVPPSDTQATTLVERSNSANGRLEALQQPGIELPLSLNDCPVVSSSTSYNVPAHTTPSLVTNSVTADRNNQKHIGHTLFDARGNRLNQGLFGMSNNFNQNLCDNQNHCPDQAESDGGNNTSDHNQHDLLSCNLQQAEPKSCNAGNKHDEPYAHSKGTEQNELDAQSSNLEETEQDTQSNCNGQSEFNTECSVLGQNEPNIQANNLDEINNGHDASTSVNLELQSNMSDQMIGCPSDSDSLPKCPNLREICRECSKLLSSCKCPECVAMISEQQICTCHKKQQQPAVSNSSVYITPPITPPPLKGLANSESVLNGGKRPNMEQQCEDQCSSFSADVSNCIPPADDACTITSSVAKGNESFAVQISEVRSLDTAAPEVEIPGDNVRPPLPRLKPASALMADLYMCKQESNEEDYDDDDDSDDDLPSLLTETFMCSICLTKFTGEEVLKHFPADHNITRDITFT